MVTVTFDLLDLSVSSSFFRNLCYDERTEPEASAVSPSHRPLLFHFSFPLSIFSSPLSKHFISSPLLLVSSPSFSSHPCFFIRLRFLQHLFSSSSNGGQTQTLRRVIILSQHLQIKRCVMRSAPIKIPTTVKKSTNDKNTHELKIQKALNRQSFISKWTSFNFSRSRLMPTYESHSAVIYQTGVMKESEITVMKLCRQHDANETQNSG